MGRISRAEILDFGFGQNRRVQVSAISVGADRTVELATVGPADGRAVVYFHSPATSGKELAGAAPSAERHGVRLVTARRPSVSCDEPHRFVGVVAEVVASVAARIGLEGFTVLGWSGGAPYALATSALLGPVVDSVHLVSPVPGPLTGPDAVPDQSPRLREVAMTTPESPWASTPAALRDYQALAAPWSFDVGSITQPVTIWAPANDEIVPRHLVDHLAGPLTEVTVVSVAGGHDWLVGGWDAVLGRLRE